MNDEKSSELNKQVIKSGSSFLFSNILIKSSAIITAPIFTRILTTSDYGIASNFAAWLNILSVIFGLGLAYSIGNAKIDFPNKLDNYFASIQVLSNIITVLGFLFAIIFIKPLSIFMNLNQDLVLFMFICLLIFPSFEFAQENYKFKLAYKENIFISIFNTFGAIFFSFIFIYLYDNQRYSGRIIGLNLPILLMGILFFIKIIQKGWHKNIYKYWLYALKISLPMIPHALAMVVLSQLDRIMIIDICGNSAAGIYSFGLAYASLALIFSNAVMQSYIPWLYINYKDDNIQGIKKSNNTITLIMCLITFVLIVIAPEMLFLLGTKEFFQAKYIIMPLATGSLFQYIYNTYSSIELYHKKTLIIAIGTVFAGFINYILNLIFIPKFGYVAAGYTTLVSYLALALFHMVACKQISKKNVFDDKFVWITTLITLLVSYFFTIFYDKFFVRYLSLILILLLVFFLQKNKFKSVQILIKNNFLNRN
jgi:O-antigen/teichoic acid export membrane protein